MGGYKEQFQILNREVMVNLEKERFAKFHISKNRTVSFLVHWFKQEDSVFNDYTLYINGRRYLFCKRYSNTLYIQLGRKNPDKATIYKEYESDFSGLKSIGNTDGFDSEKLITIKETLIENKERCIGINTSYLFTMEEKTTYEDILPSWWSRIMFPNQVWDKRKVVEIVEVYNQEEAFELFEQLFEALLDFTKTQDYDKLSKMKFK